MKNVDVLAAGENYEIPFQDESLDVGSGTSFAAPSVFLALDAIEENLPEATPELSKEILMKTVYIPNIKNDLAVTYKYLLVIENLKVKYDILQGALDTPLFPVRSGGIVVKSRVQGVSELLKAQPELTPEQAALQVLEAAGLSGADYQALWKDRGF